MSNLFLELLDSKRLAVFKKLISFDDIAVLGGGTALSLQIGHRISYDFDLFIKESISNKLWQKAKRVFGNNSSKFLENESQIDFYTPEGIKITFFHDDYKQIFETVKTISIDLMNIKDIATNKALIQGRRPKWRDYTDLYFLIKDNHIDFRELIRLSKDKFGTDFSEKLFLEQLVYWEDVKSYDIEFAKEDIETNTIKKFLTNTVKEYKKKNL